MKNLKMLFAVTVILTLVTGSASVALIGDSFHYDGTYDPDSSSPPAGNSTWTKVLNGGTSTTITPNSPSAGLADFMDSGSGGRFAMHQTTYSDTGFNTAPADYEWTYTFKMKVESTSAPATNALGFGVRHEGNSNGKAVWLGIDATDSSLVWLGAGSSKLASIDSSSYADDIMHTYTVTKFDDAGTMKVSVAVDGNTKETQIYSTFFNNDTSTEGFGLFGSTPGTWDVIVDDVVFGAVPEPSTLVLTIIGLVGLLGYAWRRRSGK